MAPVSGENSFTKLVDRIDRLEKNLHLAFDRIRELEGEIDVKTFLSGEKRMYSEPKSEYTHYNVKINDYDPRIRLEETR